MSQPRTNSQWSLFPGPAPATVGGRGGRGGAGSASCQAWDQPLLLRALTPPQGAARASSGGVWSPPPRPLPFSAVSAVSHVLLHVTCTDHRPACLRAGDRGLVNNGQWLWQLGGASAPPGGCRPAGPGSPHLAPVHLPPGLQGAGGRVSPLLRAGAGLGWAVLAGAGLQVLRRGTAGRPRPGLLRGLQGIVGEGSLGRLSRCPRGLCPHAQWTAGGTARGPRYRRVFAARALGTRAPGGSPAALQSTRRTSFPGPFVLCGGFTDMGLRGEGRS